MRRLVASALELRNGGSWMRAFRQPVERVVQA